MKLSQSKIQKIIQEELSIVLREGCGCGCGGSVGGCKSSDKEEYSQYYDQEQQGMFQTHDEEQEDEMSKEEALELVSKIASLTSCPVTRNALMGVVSDLSSSPEEDLTIHHGGQPEMDLVSIIGSDEPMLSGG